MCFVHALPSLVLEGFAGLCQLQKLALGTGMQIAVLPIHNDFLLSFHGLLPILHGLLPILHELLTGAGACPGVYGL